MTTENAANSLPKKQTIIIAPGEGPILAAFGDTVQVKLSGEETNGLLALGLGTTPPGHGPPPHIHHNEG